MSNCLWTLDVILLVIDMKHAEIDNGEFCCCDNDDDPCTKYLNQLVTCTERRCDILFNVQVSPCEENSSSEPCSLSTDEMKNAENIGDYGLLFHFTTTARANDVRKCSCTESMCVCACMCACVCVCVCVCINCGLVKYAK